MRNNNTLLLRIIVAIILLIHGMAGMFNNGVNDFGNLYLNEAGFAPIGLPLAWAIKISHVIAAICLLAEKYVKAACLVTIAILITGIFMVHLPHGWFVVGGGSNGIEFNVLLIVVLVTIMFPEGLRKTIKV